MAILAECPICHRKQSLRNKRCGECGEDLDQAKKSQRMRYWIHYRLPGGKQKKELVQGEHINPYSIADARAFQSKRTVQKRENRIFDIKADSKMTFNELTEWYLGLEKVKALPSYWLIELSLKKFNAVFGHTIISQVKAADLENYQAKRKREDKADATIDHEIGKTKTMIFKAFDNDMISGDTLKTFKKVKKLLRKNTDARTRILNKKKFDTLRNYAPIHLKGIIATAYYTGMRKGEILNLTWDKIDLKNRLIILQPADTKDGERRIIPIIDELYQILHKIPKAIHDDHVFLYKGKPIKDLRTGLRDACSKAGIPYGRFLKDGFVFHDLRHTFNTNMRKAGIPESVIMAITGHSTREMFDRYDTIDMEDTKQAMQQLHGFLENVTQTLPENGKNDKKRLAEKPANLYLS
jgi:integrase